MSTMAIDKEKCQVIKEALGFGSVSVVTRGGKPCYRWQFLYTADVEGARRKKLTAIGDSIPMLIQSAEQQKQKAEASALVWREAKEKSDRNFRQNFIDANLGNALEYWLRHEVVPWVQKSGGKMSTVARMMDALNMIKRTRFRLKRAGEITARSIDEFLIYMGNDCPLTTGKKGYSRSSVKEIAKLLKGFFEYYYGVQNRREDNPMLFIRRIDKFEAVEIKELDAGRSLSESEVEAIFKACKEGSTDDYKAHKYDWIIAFLACTGLRSGEVRALKWGDIDTEAGYIHVRRSVRDNVRSFSDEGRKRQRVVTAPKSRKSVRDVPLTEMALYALEEYRKTCRFTGGDDFVLSTKSGNIPCHNNNLWETAHSMYLRIGLTEEEIKSRKLNVHSLRHTYCTRGMEMAQTTGARLGVTAAAGHSSPQITEIIYTHGSARQLEELRRDVDEGQKEMLARLKGEQGGVATG